MRKIAWMAAWMFAVVFGPATSAQERTCEVTLSATQVDYGRLSRAMLAVDAQGSLALPSRTVGLHVRCPEAHDMSVYFRSPAADANGYRFADHGRFSLRLRDALLDGVPVELGLVHRDGTAPSRTGATLPWLPDRGLAPLKDGQIVTGREFSAQVEIETHVDDRALTVSDAARWTTTGTVEVSTAATSHELTLQADVQPGRCSVDVLRHVSFGHLRSTDLDRHGASTRVPTNRKGELRVLCDAPMPFAFRVMRDERAGTAVAPVGTGSAYTEGQLFGLGKTVTGDNIGAYVLRWSASATSDRGELSATRSIDGGKSWVSAGDAIVADHANAQRVGYTRIAEVATGPLAVNALDVSLDATIFIAPRHLIPINQEITADGLVTFEIIY
jgi:hypothetical protein